MSDFSTFLFSCRLMFSMVEPMAWVWVAVSMLASLVLLGWFWGLAWNKQWSFFGHLGSAILSILFSLLIGLSVLAWFGADRTTQWLDAQREIIKNDLNAPGAFNREVLIGAWNRLQAKGGQPGALQPPAEGGKEIQVNNDADATDLAFVAADNVKRHLLSREPYSMGLEPSVRNPADVATEVVESIKVTQAGPVSAVNMWTKTAMGMQVDQALSNTRDQLKVSDVRLKSGLQSLVGILFLIQIVVVALGALGDIKEYPRL